MEGLEFPDGKPPRGAQKPMEDLEFPKKTQKTGLPAIPFFGSSKRGNCYGSFGSQDESAVAAAMDAQEHGWLFLPGLFSLAKAKQRTYVLRGSTAPCLWHFGFSCLFGALNSQWN